MQSPVRVHEFYVRTDYPGLKVDHAIGEFGEPTIYRREGPGLSNKYMFTPGHSLKVGDIIRSRENDTIYVIKEYKDGWWKLEWPD